MPPVYQIYGVATQCSAPLSSNIPLTDAPPQLRVERRSAPFSQRFWAQMTDLSESGADEWSDRLYRGLDGRRHVLRFKDVVDFCCDSDTISYHLSAPGRGYAVELWLLGTVFTLWNELRGVPALHTAAVAVDDHAVGFLASNKGGKSSLAAAFMQAGYPLLTDDVLMVEQTESHVVGQPSYPQMRMWPDQARHFLGSEEELPLVVPHLSKCRVPVGPGGFGTFRGESAPISHLFLPMRSPDVSEVELERLSPQETLIELLRHSFLPNTVVRLGLAERRLPILMALAQQVQLYRMRYPTGVEFLPGIVDTILPVIRTSDAPNGAQSVAREES